MTNAQAAYTAFFQDPDQESRRLELTTFFGPNAATFLKAYDKLRDDTLAATSGRPKFRLFAGFEVAAFFLGPVWFFYRKMWILAWIIVAFLIAAYFVPLLGRAGLVLALLLAGMAHRSYVQHAIAKLQQLRGPDGVLNLQQVQAAGGVSKAAGIASGIVYGVLYILAIAGIIYLISHGLPPQ